MFCILRHTFHILSLTYKVLNRRSHSEDQSGAILEMESPGQKIVICRYFKGLINPVCMNYIVFGKDYQIVSSQSLLANPGPCWFLLISKMAGLITI